MKIDKQKLAAVIVPIITLVLGYMGYQPIQEARQASSSTKVEVIVPEQKEAVHSHSHSHNELKELAKEIKQVKVDLNQAIDETMNEHKERWH